MTAAVDLGPLVKWILESEGPLNRVQLKQAVLGSPGWAQELDHDRFSSRQIDLALRLLSLAQGSAYWSDGGWAIQPGGRIEPRPSPPGHHRGPLVIGRGSQSVYVAYAPVERYRAALAGDDRWPVKIGRTRRGPKRRLAELQTGRTQELVLGLVVQTDAAVALESFLHERLAPNGLLGGGAEWFRSSIGEVRAISTEWAARQSVGAEGFEPPTFSL